MIRAMVVTHGEISAQLVKVVEMIMGPTEGLSALSNANKSATELQEDVKKWLAAGDDDAGEIIMIDDYGGSCASAAMIACEGASKRSVIAGVNLAMLLGYVTWRDSEEHPELVAKIIRKGREAITLVGGR